MKNFIAQNKKLLFAIGCGLLAVIILVVVFTACVDDDKNVTEPTGVVSGVAGGTSDSIATTPGDATEPDVTEPGDITEPTIPDVTEPQKPEKPRDPNAPFEGYDYGSLTAEAWESWDWDTKMAFVKEFDATATPEEQHNFLRQTQYGGYSCGFEKHTCFSQDNHEDFMMRLADGCTICGSSECPSFFTVDPQTLFIHMDITACPMYDIHNDPQFYCQTCGLPTTGKSGDKICLTCIAPTHCPYCKADMEVGKCHHCTQP